MTATGPLWTLAIDHRNSLRRSFFGITATETAAERERACAAKRLVFDALVEVADARIAVGTPAILVDEEYGADVITAAHERGIVTAVPVEVSGRAIVEFEHGDDGFGPALERVAPTYAKVLVRYNPAGDPDGNALQRRRLNALQQWVGDHDRKWMLELLVPPTDEQLADTIGDSAAGSSDDRDAGAHSAAERYDVDQRPALTVAAVRELVDAGLRPDLWKLEGMSTSAEYAAISEAAGADGDTTSCLVLGRGANEAAVDRWLTLAAPVPGFAGFAVGRTLWWEPLRQVSTGETSRSAAVEQIADNYRRLIAVYRRAM